MDIETFTAAGLYDAAAFDAADRLRLLEFLIESGCSVDELVAADRRGRLFALAGDRVIRPERDRLTLDEVAAQLSADPADVREIWRLLGLVEANVDAPVASPADCDAIKTALDVSQVLGRDATRGVARVIAAALARVGDATSTAAQAAIPQLNISTTGSEAETAQVFAVTAGFVPRLGALLDVVFRHHLEAARMHFEGAAGWDGTTGSIEVTVGFADLSGFTSLTQSLSMSDLSALLRTFEDVADQVVRSHDGRIVKYIGDAVMYVTNTPQAGVDVALALIDAAQLRGMQARAGVAVGGVLAMQGDYFGPVVNLAARLVAMAEPGQLLITADTASVLSTDRTVVDLGSRPVRGFTDPVVVHTVR